MFDVLVFVYQNYQTPSNCPKPNDLTSRLVAAGFERQDVKAAMIWLDRLSANVAESTHEQLTLHTQAMRFYDNHERYRLGPEGINFLYHLERTGSVDPTTREVIIKCALDTFQEALLLSELKIVTLMVLWSQEHALSLVLAEELQQQDSEQPTLH